MRRLAWLGLLAARVAHADDARDVFGFTPKPIEKVDCTDGRTLGCVTATDPFDPVSPAALRSWLPTTYVLDLPVGDSRHDDVAAFATGAYRDDVGVAFGGATGLENTWTVEGAPVESSETGGIDTRIPLVFTRGINVIAGGFAARDRAALGGSIDVELVKGGSRHEVAAYAWTGAFAEPRDRPIAAQSFQLRRIAITPQPRASVAIVATGPVNKDIAGGKTWYAAGIAGYFSTFDVDWRAARLTDVDGDHIPDGLPGTTDAGGDGKVDLELIENTHDNVTTYNIPLLARTGWDRGPHGLALTLLGNVSRDATFLANATQQASGVDRTSQVFDGIASWKGTWKTTHAKAMLAWHRAVKRQSPRDSSEGSIQQLTAYVPDTLADDPVLAAACSDVPGDDVAPTVTNCPVPFGFFASNGVGELDDVVTDRPTVSVDVAHLTGNHVLRTGAWFEDTRSINTARLTGDQQLRSLFPGHTDRTRFFGDGGCSTTPGGICDYVDESRLIYRTRYTAAYVEDTFSPVPRIRVDTGLRWELMWVGPRLHFSDQFAPRLGLAWDLLGNGTTRWWASMGRTHALLPAEGMGPIAIERDLRVRDIMLNDIVDRRIDNGAVFTIADNVAAITQDEATTGFEIGVLQAIRAGAWVQRRTLRRGLETVTENIALDQALDNPGRQGLFPGIDARRDSTLVAADVLIAPSPKMSFRATYLWGRTVGSWTGPFDPRQGTVLYAGTDWDLDTHNLYGRLPTDPGQRIAVEGLRRGKLGGVELAVSTRLTVASGRPKNVLGDSDFGVVQLLPRGSNGRMPAISQANVRLAARWHATDFMLDVFNVFDRQTAVTAGETYAGDQVHPIVGGTPQDLVFAKNEACNDLMCDGTPAARRPAFGLPTSFQSPVSVLLGARRSF